MNQLMREDELLIEIANIDSMGNANKYKDEFSDVRNYSFDNYLCILERIEKLILKGYNNVEQNILIIRNGADILI